MDLILYCLKLKKKTIKLQTRSLVVSNTPQTMPEKYAYGRPG